MRRSCWLCYKKREGVNVNLDMVLNWTEEAAETGLSIALIRLAFCYYNGKQLKETM